MRKDLEEKVGSSCSSGVQLSSFGFDLSNDFIERRGYLRKLSATLIEVIIAKWRSEAQVNRLAYTSVSIPLFLMRFGKDLENSGIPVSTGLVFIAFHVGTWVVQDALTKSHISQSYEIACNTAGFIFLSHVKLSEWRLRSGNSSWVGMWKAHSITTNLDYVARLDRNFQSLVDQLGQRGYKPEVDFVPLQGQDVSSRANVSKLFGELNRKFLQDGQYREKPLIRRHTTLSSVTSSIRTKKKSAFELGGLEIIPDISHIKHILELLDRQDSTQPLPSSWSLDHKFEKLNPAPESLDSALPSTQTRVYSSPRSHTFPLMSRPRHESFSSLRDPASIKRPLEYEVVKAKNFRNFSNSKRMPVHPLNLPDDTIDNPFPEMADMEIEPEEIKRLLNVAYSLHEDGELLQAEDCYRKVEGMLDRITAPEEQELQRQLLEIRRERCAIQFQRGNFNDAEKRFRVLLTECEEVLPLRDPLTISVGRWLATVFDRKGKFAAALDYLDDLERQISQQVSLRGMPASVRDSETVRDYEQELLSIKSMKTLVLGHLGRFTEALRLGNEVAEYWVEGLDSASKQSPLRSDNQQKRQGSSSSLEKQNDSREDIESMTILRDVKVNLAKAKSLLARLYAMQELYDAAQEHNEDALKIMTEELGAEHVRTLDSSSLKSLLLAKNGSLFAAERQCRKTTTALRKRLGEKHPSTLQEICTLAYIFRLQGRLLRAEDRLLELCGDYGASTDLGDDHPQAIEAWSELSEVQISLGRLKEAEENQIGVIHAATRVFAESHPTHTKYRSVLLRIYLISEDWDTAKRIASDILGDRNERFLRHISPDPNEEASPWILRSVDGKDDISMDHLSQFLVRLSENESLWAIPYFLTILEILQSIAIIMRTAESRHHVRHILECIIEIRREKLGERHPDTVSSLMHLGVEFREAKDFKRALQILNNVWIERFDTLGKLHPDTLSARHEVSVTNFKIHSPNVDRMREVEAEQIEILEIRISLLGRTHPDTIRSWLDLAQLYIDMGQDRAARDKQEDAVKALKVLHGDRHPKTVHCQELLVRLKVKCARNELQNARITNLDHTALLAMNHLARAHCESRNWKDAKRLFKTVKGECSKNDPLRTSNELDFSLLYYYRGKFDKAERMQDDLVKEMRGSSAKVDAGTLTAMFNLALTRRSKGSLKQAFKDLDEIVELAQKYLDVGNPTRQEMQIIRQEWEKDGRPPMSSEPDR